MYGQTFVSTEVHPRTTYPWQMTEKTWSSRKSFYLPLNNHVLVHALRSTHLVMVNAGSVQSMYSYWRCYTVLLVINVM